MPELPEVETIRAGLAKRVAGRVIEKAEGGGGRLTRNNPGGVAQVRQSLTGATVIRIERRGKFMWWVLDGPDESLVVHLGMSGQVRTSSPKRQTDLHKHEHLRLTLDDGTLVHFVDPRMFGHLTLSPLETDKRGRQIPKVASHIAPDLLEFDAESDLLELASTVASRHRMIKPMLLDQSVVSGIGNIYADEGLHAAKVHGTQVGSEITEETALAVIRACGAVMTRAMQVGGTSFDSLYVDVEGNPGYFARQLSVYHREDRPCPRCGDTIRRSVIQGRAHYSCPSCQSAPGR